MMTRQEEQIESLVALRSRTVREIERLTRTLQEEVEQASAADDDSADVAADVYERGKMISLVQNLETKLRAVDVAIERAGRGVYGFCERCGIESPEERLEIVPETALCVNCASLLEQGIRRHQIQHAPVSRASRRLDLDDAQLDDPDA